MQELHKFKTNINLAEYVTSFGYIKDRKKSSLNAPVMTNKETGDKIVIGKDNKDGHFVYFNTYNDNDNGTIIDFIKNRTNENLGFIRKRCRAWLENPNPIEQINIKVSTKNAVKIANIWHNLKVESPIKPMWGLNRTYLKKLAEMPNVKCSNDKFYFMLSNLSGICGIERRNEEEKGIIKGSIKGLFANGKLKDAKRIIIFESPIDLMSYCALGKTKEYDYFLATMGSIGEGAKESLITIFTRNKDAKIIFCTDNDDGGLKIDLVLNKIIKEVDGDTDRVSKDKPKEKDWNDELKIKNSLKKRAKRIKM